MTPKTISNETECYGHIDSKVAGGTLWQAYSILIQCVLRLLPTVLICALNTWMYFKLRGIQRHRDKIFRVAKESTSASSSEPSPTNALLGNTTFPTLLRYKFKKVVCNEIEEKPFKTISEIVAKVHNLHLNIFIVLSFYKN